MSVPKTPEGEDGVHFHVRTPNTRPLVTDAKECHLQNDYDAGVLHPPANRRVRL